MTDTITDVTSPGDLRTAIQRSITQFLVAILSATIVGSYIDPFTLTTIITLFISSFYYIGFTVLERYVDPRFGWFLGGRNAPRYDR